MHVTADARVGTAVVCDDRPAVAASLDALLRACGLTPLPRVKDRDELAHVLQAEQPAVAVVALPLLGTVGVRGISVLQQLAPHCAIAVLEAGGGLGAAALRAGARAVVPDGDLRPLRTLLRSVTEHQAGLLQPRQPEAGSVSTNPAS